MIVVCHAIADYYMSSAVPRRLLTHLEANQLCAVYLKIMYEHNVYEDDK